MKQALLEKLLASEFTFGFELEAKLDPYKTLIDKKSDGWAFFTKFCETENIPFDYRKLKTYGELKDILSDFVFDNEDMDDDTFTEVMEKVLSFEDVKEIAKKQFNFNDYFKNKKYVVAPSKGFTYDGSLDSEGFEWRSPVLKFTPDCIIECIGFLQDIKNTFIIDNQCGFHTHIAFNGITPDDAMWLELKLAMDEDERNEITELVLYTDPAAEEYEPIDYSNRFASSEYLEKLSSAITDKNYEKVASLLTNEKYRALRIHPQGTMEWRAPRGFLDEDVSTNYIKSFFLQLHQFVRWMIDALDENFLEDCDLDRNNLLEMIKSYANKENLFKDKTTKGDDNIFKRIYDLDKKALKNIDKIPSSKLDKVLLKIMRSEDISETFFTRLLAHLRYYNDIPEKLFAKIYAFSSPDARDDLIDAHSEKLLPIKDMVQEHQRIFGRGNEQNTISELFMGLTGKVGLMSDEDIINLLSSGYKMYNHFLENLIKSLVSRNRFSNKIRNAIISNDHLTSAQIDTVLDNLKIKPKVLTKLP